MRFAKLSGERKKLNERFFQLYLYKHARLLSVQEERELSNLSLVLQKECLRLPFVYLSASELATCLKVSYYQVKKWIEEGLLSAHKTSTGRYQLISYYIAPQLRSLGYEFS